MNSHYLHIPFYQNVWAGSVAQSDAHSVGDEEVVGFIPSRFYRHWVQQHSFLAIDHEIFSVVILSLLLNQEGQLSVSGKKNVSKYWLTI